MMRFVKTADELARLRAIYREPRFLDSRVLSLSFETTAEAVRALLPPPLEPADRPLASATVMEFRASNCVGPFLGASMNVRARYGNMEGNYCVTMPMSTDIAIMFGRELYGEPKKQARITLEREGRQVTGRVERYGVQYIELAATLDETGAAGHGEGSTFHYKYLHSADGLGFDFDPLLIHIRTESRWTLLERGRGALTFRDSPHDPVADIPIVSVLGASYTEGEVATFGRTLCRVDPEAFLPYSFGKIDAMDLLAAKPPLVVV